LVGAPNVVTNEVLDKTMECGQTPIARRNAVSSNVFEMCQEGNDYVGAKIVEPKARHWAPLALSEKAKEQPESISVST
jgi:hypothetical protein